MAAERTDVVVVGGGIVGAAAVEKVPGIDSVTLLVVSLIDTLVYETDAISRL